MFKAIATPVSPFDWPVNTDPQFENKTSDAYTDEVNPTSIIQSLWSSQPCTFDIQIVGNPVAESDTITVTSAVLTTPPTGEPDLTYSVQNATTTRVTGTTAQQPGEYYEFKMRDKTVIQLPPDNDQDWLAVTKWNTPPRPWYRIATYTFTVTYTGTVETLPVSGTDTFEVTQYIYWHWEPSLAKLKQLAAEGEL